MYETNVFFVLCVINFWHARILAETSISNTVDRVEFELTISRLPGDSYITELSIRWYRANGLKVWHNWESSGALNPTTCRINLVMSRGYVVRYFNWLQADSGRAIARQARGRGFKSHSIHSVWNTCLSQSSCVSKID